MWVSQCANSDVAFGAWIAAPDHQYAATASSRPAIKVAGATHLTLGTVSQNSFTAEAAGSISTAVNTVDVWTINEGKYLRNVTNGTN